MKPVLLGIILASTSMASCAADVAAPPGKGISRPESATIAPYPPREVRVTIVGEIASLKWEPAADSKIVGYDVFRGVNDGPLEKVSRVPKASFVDAFPPKTSVRYAVSAVDYNDNVSRPRPAVVEPSGSNK
jgi:hypothetical protein